MRNKLLATLLLFLAVLPAQAARRTTHHRARPKPYVAFPPSHANLVAQNEEANRLGLQRIADENELGDLIDAGELFAIQPSPALRVNIPAFRSYARPWVVDFLNQLSVDFYERFGVPLQVNSAVRTIRFQKKLRRYNHNAAPATGDCASVHLAALAFDLQRRGLTRQQMSFLRLRLLVAVAAGRVIVEEEIRNGGCFHVVVRGPGFIAIPLLDMPVPTSELSPVGIPDFL